LETPVTWNQQGPAGPPGLKGDKGDKGAPERKAQREHQTLEDQ